MELMIAALAGFTRRANEIATKAINRYEVDMNLRITGSEWLTYYQIARRYDYWFTNLTPPDAIGVNRQTE